MITSPPPPQKKLWIYLFPLVRSFILLSGLWDSSWKIVSDYFDIFEQWKTEQTVDKFLFGTKLNYMMFKKVALSKRKSSCGTEYKFWKDFMALKRTWMKTDFLIKLLRKATPHSYFVLETRQIHQEKEIHFFNFQPFSPLFFTLTHRSFL